MKTYPIDIIGKQMDFLFNEGKKLGKKSDIEDEENELQIQREIEEDMFVDEETLCGKPHNNGNNEPENCNECMMIKEDI